MGVIMNVIIARQKFSAHPVYLGPSAQSQENLTSFLPCLQSVCTDSTSYPLVCADIPQISKIRSFFKINLHFNE